MARCSMCDTPLTGRKRTWCSAKCGYRARGYRRRYGLSVKELGAFKASGLCALCLEPARGRMSIDHNHKTGEVRGWVHQQCNLIIAHVEDRLEKVEMAKVYLGQHA